MFGVVLWSDDAESKAIIWCEDHGDLAYYDAHQATDRGRVTLEAGDLVQFDVVEGRERRLARNPALVAGRHYPTLVGRLKSADQSEIDHCEIDRAEPEAELDAAVAPTLPAEGGSPAGASAVIIPFAAAARRRSAAALETDAPLWTVV